MRLRGCLGNLLYLSLLLVAFGASSYFWFKFFVRGKSLQTPNLVGRSLADARAMASDLGLVMMVDNREDRNSDRVPPGAVVWQNRSARSLIKRGTRLYVGQSLGPLVLRVPDLTGQSPQNCAAPIQPAKSQGREPDLRRARQAGRCRRGGPTPRDGGSRTDDCVAARRVSAAAPTLCDA